MPDDISYAEISGSLGSLLLVWARIEQQARVEVAKAHGGTIPKSAHGIAGVLNVWEKAVVSAAEEGTLRGLLAPMLRTLLREPLDLRNGICHGLTGVSAAHDGAPARLTWTINEMTQSIGWDEWQAVLAWLSKVPFAIQMISNGSAQKPGNRMTDSAENRAWWLGEFGIALNSRAQRDAG